MKLNGNETTVKKLEHLRKKVRSDEFCTGSELIAGIQKDIKTGRWLKRSQCCGTQGCCDNTNATY